MTADFPVQTIGGAPQSAPSRPANIGMWLMGGFAAWMWLQTFWAASPALHFEGCVLFTKYVILIFLLERLIRTERALEAFGWAHVAGCFIWSWLAYTLYDGGRIELDLGSGVSDSNTLGVHLVTGAAFAGLMLVALPFKRRVLVLGAIPFILNGIILTGSRGATLAMIAAGIGALMFAPRTRRGIVYASAALGAVLFLALAGSELYWQRMGTLRVEEGEEVEASAASRIDIARANWRMFVDHPMGAGYRGNMTLSPDYIPEQWLTDGRRSAHNTFLAVLVDTGVIGVLLYGSTLAWAAFSLFRLRRLDRRGLPIVLGTFRGAVAAGLLGYVVAGMFSNYLSAEVGIWLVALVAVLNRLGFEAIAALPSGERVALADSGPARPLDLLMTRRMAS